MTNEEHKHALNQMLILTKEVVRVGNELVELSNQLRDIQHHVNHILVKLCPETAPEWMKVDVNRIKRIVAQTNIDIQIALTAKAKKIEELKGKPKPEHPWKTKWPHNQKGSKS